MCVCECVCKRVCVSGCEKSVCERAVASDAEVGMARLKSTFNLIGFDFESLSS